MHPQIIGIGVDLIEIKRIEKASQLHARFAAKILHPLELEIYQSYSHIPRKQTAFLAKRFAAKEAISKALGLGMRSPMNWQAVAVVPNDLGQPSVICFAALAAKLDDAQQQLLISLSDERLYAQAFAILLKN